MASHQDWQTVYLRKPAPAVTTVSVQKQTTANGSAGPAFTNATSKPSWKIEQQVDDPNSKTPLPFVTKEDATKITQARIAAKLTQKQLAQRLNQPERVIKDIESGKAVENKALLARIKKLLNMAA